MKQRPSPTNDVMTWSTVCWHVSGTRQRTDRDRSIGHVVFDRRQCDSTLTRAASRHPQLKHVRSCFVDRRPSQLPNPAR